MKPYLFIAVFLVLIVACAAGTSGVPQDTILADQGYRELLEGNYDRAEANLKVALTINPQNPYALLNLGVLYQDTGRLEDARRMYQTLIDLNPDDVAVKTTLRKHDGKKLADIAKANMTALGFPQK